MNGPRVRIAIAGGTGAFGRALAARLRDLGHDVSIGSRDESRAQERAAVLGVSGGTNESVVRNADLVVLAVAEIRAALERRRVPVVAVSPLIGGRAVKGPADAMLVRLAGGTSPAHVAGCYRGLIDTLVVDEADTDAVADLGVRPVVTRTLMRDEDARRRLMESVLEAAGAFA